MRLASASHGSCAYERRNMTDPDRILTPARRAEDVDAALRPKTLDEFVGQKAARENLRVFISAASDCRQSMVSAAVL